MKTREQQIADWEKELSETQKEIDLLTTPETSKETAKLFKIWDVDGYVNVCRAQCRVISKWISTAKAKGPQ